MNASVHAAESRWLAAWSRVRPDSIHKRALRTVSAWLVLTRRRFALACEPDQQAELLSRCEHYLGHLEGARLIVKAGSAVTGYELTAGVVTGGVAASRWSFLFAALLGRVLVCRDTPWLRRVEKLLYAKLFIVDWRSTYRTVAWRFAASGSDRRAPAPPSLETHGDTVVLLGTGPSAGRIFDDRFRGYDVITCNTALKSERLSRERRVVALCVSDACFFTGSSEYSRTYLASLRERTANGDVAIYHDRDHAGILGRVLAPTARHRMHGVEFSPHFRGRHSFGERCYQAPYGNVLTALMLPLAATFYRRIVLVGFDGKGATKNYFWKHADEFQFQDQLPTVRASYPCFFSDVDYDRYSLDHNTILEDMCARIEADGRQILMAHESSIPSLAARMVAFPAVPSGAECVEDAGRVA